MTIGLGTSIYLWHTGIERTISPFLAAVSSTVLSSILIQTMFKKREKKEKAAETMRKEIFGPLFEEISAISEKLGSASRWGSVSTRRLGEIKSHHLFSFVDPNLRENLSKIAESCEIYERMRNAKILALNDIIKEDVMEICKVNIGPEEQLVLRLCIGKAMVSSTFLRECIFKQIEPKDLVAKESKKFGDNAKIEFEKGACKGLSGFQSLYDNVMKRIENNQIFLDEIEKRQNLIEELRGYSEKIKSLIDISK